MSRSRPAKSDETPAQRRLERDLAFSHAIVIAAIVLLLVVVIADVLYVAYAPRRGGHLRLPAFFFVAPLVAVLLVALTAWNWRAMRRRAQSSSLTHSSTSPR